MSKLPAASRAEQFQRAALSKATLRAYGADWRHFMTWCEANERKPMPATIATVCDYLAGQAESHARSTIERRLVTIAQAHKLAGHAWSAGHPQIRATLRGMFRLHGRPATKAAALGAAETRAMVAAVKPSFTGRRDRALLLVALAGAFRRSELAGLRMENIAINAAGLRVLLPRSKSDQMGEGRIVGIPRGKNPDTCPVAALEQWLAAAPGEGAVFRQIRADGTVVEGAMNPYSIARIIKAHAAGAGIVAGPGERLSAHGMRAGCITDLYKKGVPDLLIMDHARQRDHKTMLGYVRRAQLTDQSPAGLLDL